MSLLLNAFVVLLAVAGPVPMQGGTELVRVSADSEHLQRLGFDLANEVPGAPADVVLHGPRDAARLRATGFRWTAVKADASTRKAVGTLPSGRTSYRRLADYQADLAGLANSYPGKARTFTLARPTLEGRQVTALEIARGSDAKPTMVLMGLHHAREWPAGEAAIEFAFDLLRNDSTDPRITSILDRVKVIVVPVVNPDGFHMSRELVYEMKRKNCRIRDGQTPAAGECQRPANFQLGVDLNRNYAQDWAPGSDKTSELYPGAGPLSEPEDQNIRDLVAARQVTFAISNHTYGNVILRPTGPEDGIYSALGNQLAAQTGYSSGSLSGVPTTERWIYYATGGFAFLPEINPSQFHPAYASAVVDQYLGTGGRGGLRGAYLVAAEAAADRAKHSVLTGTAPPGATLRITKDFNLRTASGVPVPTHLESVITVPANGQFTWDVNPSTRPTASGVIDERWTLTCALPGGPVATVSVLVRRGQQANLDLSACAADQPVFFDNFETDRGWTVSGNATAGRWERGIPGETSYQGTVCQRSNGTNALVTGLIGGVDCGLSDVDGGVTSITSPVITLPSTGPVTLSFRCYLAHLNNATSADYLRIKVGNTVVFERLAAASNVSAAWQNMTVNLSAYTGQTIRLTIEAADNGAAGLVEAAVDDVLVN